MCLYQLTKSVMDEATNTPMAPEEQTAEEQAPAQEEAQQDESAQAGEETM